MSTVDISKSFYSKIPSLALGIFSFVLVVYTQLNVGHIQSLGRAKFIAPPPMIERFVFGFNEAIADSFWIRTVQDLDYCDQETGHVNGVSICTNNSWLYKMIDTITDLSPKFRAPYSAGALALTVLITDIDGATKIFEKGIKQYPKDWPMLYRAAYHYMYEVKDNKRAAELLIQAGKNGAPKWTLTLAGRLYSNAGNLELAEAVLQDMIATNQEPALIKRLQQKIDSIKSEKR